MLAAVARGESQKASPRSAALGVWAVFGVLVAAVVLLMLLTTRACESESPAGAAPEPFSGAGHALGTLGWRDCLDGPELDSELPARLRYRGYVGPSEPRSVELPFEGVATELEGACGVIAVSGARGAVLDGVAGGAEETPRPPCSPPYAAIGVCGAARITLTGTGQATLTAWTYPGLTPRDVERTGIEPDLLLAQAEAERLLVARGFSPGLRALAVDVAARTTTFDPPQPDHGCVAWVVAGRGLSAGQGLWDGTAHGYDRARRRLLVGVATCDGPRRGQVRFDDPGADGGRLVALPYALGDGPALPGDRAPVTRLPDVRAAARPEDVPLPVGEP